MEERPRGPNYAWLVAVVVLGLGYAAARAALSGQGDMRALSGIAGVLLGLFICAQPAANFLELILFGRYMRVELMRRYGRMWITLNAFVMFVGWLVVVLGVIEITARR